MKEVFKYSNIQIFTHAFNDHVLTSSMCKCIQTGGERRDIKMNVSFPLLGHLIITCPHDGQSDKTSGSKHSY